jgi:DNA-binding NarL/FixJ family response regulator
MTSRSGDIPRHGRPGGRHRDQDSHGREQRRRGRERERDRPGGRAVVHVVILTTYELDEYVFEGLRADTAGFLVKDTDAAELIHHRYSRRSTMTDPASRRIMRSVWKPSDATSTQGR